MIVGIWGEDKTGKTTLALTFPKPLAYMELDIGGFNRAKYRFKEEIAGGNIITKYKDRELSYAIPLQISIQPKAARIIIGVKELWYKFLMDYLNLLQEPGITTIVVDTATLLWELICTGYIQEKQEVQLDSRGNLLPGERLRISLIPIEYREPNIRMRGLIYQAKIHGKHLVMTHHARDSYKPAINPKTGAIEEIRSGEKERSGFAGLGDVADTIIHTYIIKNSGELVPTCKIDLSELLPLTGMVFPLPTYEKIITAMTMIRGE